MNATAQASGMMPHLLLAVWPSQNNTSWVSWPIEMPWKFRPQWYLGIRISWVTMVYSGVLKLRHGQPKRTIHQVQLGGSGQSSHYGWFNSKKWPIQWLGWFGVAHLGNLNGKSPFLHNFWLVKVTEKSSVYCPVITNPHRPVIFSATSQRSSSWTPSGSAGWPWNWQPKWRRHQPKWEVAYYDGKLRCIDYIDLGKL